MIGKVHKEPQKSLHLHQESFNEQNKIHKTNLKTLFDVLMIDSESRSLNDIKILREILLDVQGLKNLQSTSELDYICRYLKIIRLKKGEFVFQKDKGKLYIILQGSIGVYTRQTSQSSSEEVHSLNTTDCFGELVQGNSRDASHNFVALSLQDSILAVITAQAYQRFQQLETNQLSNVEQSIKEFKPFAKLTAEQIQNIAKKSSLVKVASNTQVIRQGEIPKALFLVRKGILKMCRNVKFAHSNDSLHQSASPFKYEIKMFCIRQLVTGDYFPPSQIQKRVPMQTTIISASPCQLVLIPYKEIESLFGLFQTEVSELSDNQIKIQFGKKEKWREYKNKYIESLYVEIENKRNMNNSRGQLRPVRDARKPLI